MDDATKELKGAALEAANELQARSVSALANSRFATRIAIIAIALSTIMAIQKIIEWYSLR